MQLSCVVTWPTEGNSALSVNTVMRIALLAHLLAGQTPRPHAVPLKAGNGYFCQVQAQDAPASSALLISKAEMLMSYLRT